MLISWTIGATALQFVSDWALFANTISPHGTFSCGNVICPVHKISPVQSVALFWGFFLSLPRAQTFGYAKSECPTKPDIAIWLLQSNPNWMAEQILEQTNSVCGLWESTRPVCVTLTTSHKWKKKIPCPSLAGWSQRSSGLESKKCPGVWLRLKEEWTEREKHRKTKRSSAAMQPFWQIRLDGCLQAAQKSPLFHSFTMCAFKMKRKKQERICPLLNSSLAKYTLLDKIHTFCCVLFQTLKNNWPWLQQSYRIILLVWFKHTFIRSFPSSTWEPTLMDWSFHFHLNRLYS